jgi:hypothetical protein
MTEYMNVGWMDALKVVSKNIWRCVMHIHKFCVDVRCAKILGSYSWSMPLEHLMWWSQSSVFCKPVINISGGCFSAYSIVSLSFSLRFRSLSCLHHVWATKILPLSLNGVPDHILQFGCRRQMEDFHTVCRSKLCFCRLPNFPVAWSTLLKGLVFKKEPSNLLSYYVHFQIQHASCFKKPCMAIKGNLYTQS